MNSNRQINKNKRKDFQGETSLYIRLSVVSTVVCGLNSQSQPTLSSSQNNVSVSDQSNLVLSDLWTRSIYHTVPPTGKNFLRSCLRVFSHCSRKYRQRMCCAIDEITRWDAFFFYFIINNKTRRIIDFLNYNKEPEE